MIIEKTRPWSPFSLDHPPVFARQIEYRLTATICAQHKLYTPHQYRLHQHLISKIKTVLSQTGRGQNKWTLQPPPMMKPVRTTHAPFACANLWRSLCVYLLTSIISLMSSSIRLQSRNDGACITRIIRLNNRTSERNDSCDRRQTNHRTYMFIGPYICVLLD